MERKNSLRMRIIMAVLILLLTAATVLIFTFLNINIKLQDQVDQRDSIINNLQQSDSIFSKQNEKIKDSIEKYFSGCGILINGKEISTEELVQFLNNSFQKIYKLEDTLFILKQNLSQERKATSLLKNALIQCYDSLSIYKTVYNLTKKNLKVDFQINEADNQRTVSLNLPSDSLQIFKKLYELAQKHYGIEYQISKDNGYIVYTKMFTKADSAFIIFNYYKDKLRKDKEGNWIIDFQKNTRKSKGNK